MAIDSPFVIHTELSLQGIEIGLRKLEKRLSRFKLGKRPIRVVDNKNIDIANRKMAQLEATNKRLRQQITKTNVALKGTAKAANQTKNAFTDVARRVFVWGSMAAVIFGALQNLKELEF